MITKKIKDAIDVYFEATRSATINPLLVDDLVEAYNDLVSAIEEEIEGDNRLIPVRGHELVTD